MYSRFVSIGTLVVLTTSLFGASLLDPPSATAQDADTQAAPAKAVSADYRKGVSKLLELSGAQGIGEQVAFSIAQETLGAIAATGTPITEPIQQVVVEEALEDFGAKFGSLEFLTDVYAPLYAEHLSEKELQGILDFYESDIGKKTLEVLPVIAQSAMMSLQQASMAQVPDFQVKVDSRLRKEGLVETP